MQNGAHASARPAADGSATVEQHLCAATYGLVTRFPELSAASGLPGWQKRTLAGLAAAAASGALLAPEMTLVVLLAVMALPFLLVVALRAVALWHLLKGSATTRSAKTVAIDETALPLYTVLVPLYREAAVVPHLLHALGAIDYPHDKLEVLLLVESVDQETQAAVREAALAGFIRMLVVPDGTPRTKPRALQYALQFAQGDFVVVYDAEDVPAPDQLRRALSVLCAEPGRIGCLQAQLNIYNSQASWLTRGIVAFAP